MGDSIINEFFDLQELDFIKRQIWWTGCQEKHFMVKGGVFKEQYMLIVTNLKQVWVGKAEKEEILLELKTYNPALDCDVSQFEQVLKQIHNLLNQGNKQIEFNKLDFIINESKDLEIKVQYKLDKLIPFKWEFITYQIPEKEAQQLITTDIISSLILTIQAQDQRSYQMKLQYQDLEKQYKNILPERQRNNYRSKMNDNEENWKFFVKDFNQNPLNPIIPKINFSESSEYFLQEYTSQSLPGHIRKKQNNNTATISSSINSVNLSNKQQIKNQTQNTQLLDSDDNSDDQILQKKTKKFVRNNNNTQQQNSVKKEEIQINIKNDIIQDEKKIEIPENIPDEELLDDKYGEILEQKLQEEIKEKQQKKEEKNKKKKKLKFL